MFPFRLLGCLQLCALLLIGVVHWTRSEPQPAPAPTHAEPTGAIIAETGNGWFKEIKPYCNPVEAAVMIQRNPPPQGHEGRGYAAACYALAGRIDRAQAEIEALPLGRRRSDAASIVFRVGHPVADAGDDDAAGPIMRLVVRYQPRNYMALYHAGIAEYNTGDTQLAKKHLERFLEIYDRDDGWRKNGLRVLGKIESRSGQHVLSGHGEIR